MPGKEEVLNRRLNLTGLFCDSALMRRQEIGQVEQTLQRSSKSRSAQPRNNTQLNLPAIRTSLTQLYVKRICRKAIDP